MKKKMNQIERSTQQIPTTINIIWIGDDAKRPDYCIDTWRHHHPDYEFRIWGNQEYSERKWKLQSAMDKMWKLELCGVADLMRWEILADEGGIAVDADSICEQPLPAWLHSCTAFVSSENEVVAPGLLTPAFMGTVPRNLFFERLVHKIQTSPKMLYRRKWYGKKKWLRAYQSVGPCFLTEQLKKSGYPSMTVLPSHFFSPDHHTGFKYSGSGPVYARQLFGSTIGYDQLELKAH